jgi:PAS domain S-box-containing protein
MKDTYRTNSALIEEISFLQQRIKKLEKSESDHIQTEKKLRENEEKFAVAFLKSAIPMAITTIREDRYTDVNEAFSKAMGIEREDLIGNTSTGVGYITLDQRALFLNELNKKGYVENLELQTRIKGGEIRYGLFNSSKIKIDDEDYLLTMVTDITERKRAEKKLQESEEKYRILVETTSTGFVILNEDGRVLDANPEYVRFTGHHDLREIVGRSVIEWTADYEKEKNSGAIKAVFEKGYVRNLQIDYVDSKGNITSIEINATSMEIEGKIQIITICRDITEHRQAEEELKKHRDHLERLIEDRTGELKNSENKYRSIFENANDAILLAREGILIDCNAKALELFGVTREQIIGQTPHKLSPPFQPDGSDSRKKARVDAALSGVPQRFEWQHIRSNGTVFDTEINLHAVNVGEERLLQALIHDITERKRIEEALRESENRLKIKAKTLEEFNTALKVLLQQKTNDEKQLEERFASNVNQIVLPYIEKMKKSRLDSEQNSCLSIIELNLNEIVSPFLHSIRQLNFTSREAQVASLIKMGKSTKEIAAILGVAPSAVDTYRNNIRSKLKLKKKKVNLRSYLQFFK